MTDNEIDTDSVVKNIGNLATFLSFVKVLRMLYSKEIAEKVFTKYISKYYA